MRLTLLLLITVFISTIFWPELLSGGHLLFCVLLTFIFLSTAHLRVFALIPFALIYFNIYALLTLTGQPFIFTGGHQGALSQRLNDKQDHNIVVRVNSLISQKNQGYFRATLLEIDAKPLSFSPQLEMRWYKPTLKIQAGEVHRFQGRLKTLNKRLNPGTFDRQKWQYSHHIAYQFSIKKHLSVQSTDLSLRGKLYQSMQGLTQGYRYQGVILALSFADKSLLSVIQKEQIREWGVAHLFVISGLHIGLLFSAVFFMMSRFHVFLLGWAHWHVASVLALSVACFYAYLAGFSLPTQRALLLLFLSVGILSMRRQCSLLDIVPLLLCILLINDPLAVLSMSLWLSYGAICIIFLFCWRFPAYFKRPKKSGVLRRVGHYFKLLLGVQFAITALMIPLQIHYFSALSVGGMLMNLFAIPVFSLCVIPLILLALFCSLGSIPVATVLISVVDTLLGYFFFLLDNLPAYYFYFSAQQSAMILSLFTLFFVSWVITWHGVYALTARFVVCSLLILMISDYLQKKTRCTNVVCRSY